MPRSSRLSPPSGLRPGRTLVLLVTGLVLLCAVVVAVGWLFTHPLEATMRGENDINRWFVRQRSSTLTDAADGGTMLGQTITGLVALAVLGIGFAVWKRTWWPLVFAVVLDAGMGLFYLAATSLDPRNRPPVHILQSGLVPDHSFPSGHTGTATAIGGTLAVLLWSYTRVAVRLLVLLVVLPAYTMVSRLYVGAHHLSDVLTAFVYAVVWLLLCARLLLPARSEVAGNPQRP